MLCEKCKKNQAVTHIRRNINGVQSEMHLCKRCAAEMTGSLENTYNKLFSDFGFGLDSVLGSIFGQDFLGENLLTDTSEHCPMCGMTLQNIQKTGNVGCAKCYETFRGQLMPFIQRIHGKTVHNGRIPSSAAGSISVKNKINELEKKLHEAVEAQEYEQAAKLRDEIRTLREQL